MTYEYNVKNIPRDFLIFLYMTVKKRCTSPKPADIKYKGMYLCPRKDFLRKFLYSKKFLRMFHAWVAAGRNLELTPSIDRIDSRRGYYLDNIQIITNGENRRKDSYTVRWIEAYTKKGEYIGRFRNRHIASGYLGVPQLKIWHVLDGQIKQTYGYTFKWWIPPNSYLTKRLERDKKRAICAVKLEDPGTQS